MLKAAEELIEQEAQKKIHEIPLSNDTIRCSPYFALQCDKSTDVLQCRQLLVFIRFLNDNTTFQEELIFSQELKATSQGTDVMDVISQYCEKHGLMWQKLAGFCTDGAPAMFGSRSGIAALIKEKNPSAIMTQFCYSSSSSGCQNAPGMLCYYDENSYKSSQLY
ncbi:hypothetical protein ILUMI_19882 [Ignelater luminosus]|uniref:DUF4371 domain-containing protein n=1 Tax=Ignelater luminosus TaxID=2038154 RepID=A0A8K0G560_IGNLU|nr:hypothetical protein ILUMI_19882 [Ignelater luminosus]